MVTVNEAVARARSLKWLDKAQTRWLIEYSLGAGNWDPDDPDEPCTVDAEPMCDCSGFVAWVLKYNRRQKGYADGWGWVNTDSMIADARAKAAGRPTDGWWDIVKGVRPGDIVVYGSVYGKSWWRKKTVRKRIGHVGLVTHVPEWPNWDTMRVVHCSMGNYRRYGHAIAETSARAWNVPKTQNPSEWSYFLRYTKYQES